MFYFLNRQDLINYCKPTVVYQSANNIHIEDPIVIKYYHEGELPVYLTIKNERVVIPSDLELHAMGLINIDSSDVIDINGNILSPYNRR